MDLLVKSLENFIESKEFSGSGHFIPRYGRDSYTVVFEVLKDWVLEGLDQHLNHKQKSNYSTLLASAALVYCSWVILNVLKNGTNDKKYNAKKLRYILLNTGLIDKVDLVLIDDFLISGLGMSISQSSNILSIPNHEICHKNYFWILAKYWLPSN